LDTYLHKVGHDVAHIGWQSFGQEMVASFHKDVLGYRILPNIYGDRFGERAIKYWLPKENPDVLITLADFWMISYLYKTEIPVPWLYWFPIDGYPVTDQIKEILKRVDYKVCISKYGADLIKAEGIQTDQIPHGVKTNIFKPLDEQTIGEMRQKLGIPPSKIVIGRVDRNQTRKKIPRTIKSFVKLHKDYPNTVLLLWMDKVDKEGWDLSFIVKRFGLQEGKDVIFPSPDMMANFMYGVSEETLAEVYNCIDIFCYLTGGEGWGLTLTESLSCGCANVATTYTTSKEILGNWTCGLPVKVETFETGSAGVDRALADVDHAYEQMKWLIENPDEKKAMSERGVKRAREVYDINIIVKQFDEYLRDRIE